MRYCTNCGHQLHGGFLFCSRCGQAVRSASVPVEAAAGTSGSTRFRKIGFLIIALLVLSGMTVYVLELTRSDHPVISKQPIVAQPIDYKNAKIGMVDIPSRVEGGKVIFSLEDVRRLGLVRIHYQGRTSTTPVLAYISGEGRLVTAISRSEPDNATTFSIEGTAIKCGNCPANWQLDNMKANACCPRNFPAPISSRVDENEVHIEENVIARWTSRL